MAVTGLLAASLAACGNSDDDENGGGSNGGGELSGSVVADGSSTVAPLGEAAAELFMTENPGVQVTVGTSGTGGGFEKFCAGETDISEASRDIKDEEAQACADAGIEFVQLGVANDALTVMANQDNPVDCLTVEQLQQIWGPDSTLSNWSEIEGLDADFDEELDLYGPGTDSGTFDFFTEAINGEGGVQRTDYNNIGEDDNSGILGVEGSAGGLFYSGYSYYLENQDRVKAIEIDNGDGCVAPAEETVQDGSYAPLGRQLYIFPSDQGLEKEQVRAFVEYFVSNSGEVAEAAGFIGLTEDQEAEALESLDSIG
ncbi:PstS family phosphate ABC transporter substrate-binding protein [Glycomyces xiaoerkulensis]|uniref:PstS family phosphate ABC transporter substrate-binding protein n=1 Tax=Glycomyces xiaoerkulensis TaxID=2038139 RepID=UPI0018E3FC2B|nr:PstS family phosphate ABC transporter substrate-binding protein [Glycomyces xiaoerkulensis]